MTLADIVITLSDIAQQHHLSKPYVVGGVPRNIILRKFNPHMSDDIRDVDITTGDDDIHKLARHFADREGGQLIKVDDRHFEVKYRGRIFDFSKNIRYPDIDRLLKDAGIAKGSDLQKETFSRDFTANALLLSPDFKHLLDLTGRGQKDIASKILTCPVDCHYALSFDPKRILRAYYFKAKYGFSFSDELHEAIIKLLPILPRVNRRYASEMINKILRADEGLLDDLIQDGVLKQLPMTRHVKDLLIRKKKLLEFL